MRYDLAMVKNVRKLWMAYDALKDRDPGIPGMGLVYGFTGAGKTTAITRLVNEENGIHVRACAIWTATSMLRAIMTELSADPLARSDKMFIYITKKLAEEGRPLFVDEADYVLANLKMLETLRDLHDLSEQPVVLIGMEGLEKKLVHRKQLARRISQWVEFQPADLDDARTLADTVCEVEVAECLLKKMHDKAKGSMGKMTTALSKIESLARVQGWPVITAEQWGDRDMFFDGPNGNGKGRKG